MLQSSGLIRPTPSSAKTAAATFTDGFKTVQALSDALAAATGGVAGVDGDAGIMINLGVAGQGRRDRGVSLMIASTEADGASISMKPRLVYGPHDFNPRSLTAAGEFRLLGTATLTVGSGTGVSGSGLVGSDYRFVDTITWSGSTYAALIATLRETDSIDSLKFSPVDNTIAVLNIPDCDNAAALHIEFVNANASKSTIVVARVGT